MNFLSQLAANHELSKDSLSDRALAAVDGSGNANLIVTAAHTRYVVREHEPTERCVDQYLWTVALLVGVVKELGDDNSLFVGDVDTRIGNALEECILAPDLVVQDAVATDDLGVDVGEQPIRDVLLLAEFRKYLLIIVRDRVELDSGGLEFFVCIAQLTELRPTRRSPDRRSVEHDDGLCLAPALVIVDEPPMRVGKLEVWKSLADGRASRVSIRKAAARGMTEWGRSIEAVMIAFYCHAHSSRFGEPILADSGTPSRPIGLSALHLPRQRRTFVSGSRASGLGI